MQKRGSKKIKDRASYEPYGPSVGWLIDRLVVRHEVGRQMGRLVGWPGNYNANASVLGTCSMHVSFLLVYLMFSIIQLH